MLVRYGNKFYKLVKILPDKAIIEYPDGWDSFCVKHLNLNPTKKYWYVNLDSLKQSRPSE